MKNLLQMESRQTQNRDKNKSWQPLPLYWIFTFQGLKQNIDRTEGNNTPGFSQVDGCLLGTALCTQPHLRHNLQCPELHNCNSSSLPIASPTPLPKSGTGSVCQHILSGAACLVSHLPHTITHLCSAGDTGWSQSQETDLYSQVIKIILAHKPMFSSTPADLRKFLSFCIRQKAGEWQCPHFWTGKSLPPK